MKILENKIGKQSFKLFYLYIVFFYIVPMILHRFFVAEFAERYQNSENYFALPIIFVVVGLVIVFDKIIPNLILSAKWSHRFNLMNAKWFNILLSVLFLYFSFKFYNEYELSYRHTSSLSDSQRYVTLLFVLREYFVFYIFYVMCSILNGIKIEPYKRVLCLFISTSYFFSMMTSVDTLYIVFALILAIKKESLVMFNRKASSIIKKISLIILGLMLTLSVIFVGFANKIGVDNTASLFKDNSARNLIVSSVSIRVSVFYVAVMSAAIHCENQSQVELIESIYKNTVLNFIKVLGGFGSKPSIWSVSRMNFLNLWIHNEKDTTGTAPGLVASVFYLPFFPIGIFIIIFYAIFILRRWTLLIDSNFIKNKIGIIPMFFFLLIVMSLFSSPVDMINIFDIGFIDFFLFLQVSQAVLINQEKKESI